MIMSVVAFTMTGRAQVAFGLTGMSSSAIGRAATMMAAVIGSRITADQVRRADEHRDHRAGKRAAKGELVDQVRHLVCGDVRGAEAARANALREHDRPT